MFLSSFLAGLAERHNPDELIEAFFTLSAPGKKAVTLLFSEIAGLQDEEHASKLVHRLPTPELQETTGITWGQPYSISM